MKTEDEQERQLHDLALNDAIVGQRKLRATAEEAEELQEAIDELMNAEEYPGHERVVEAARVLAERLHWLLGDDVLKTRSVRAGHLLDHGVQVVAHLLDVVTHEAPDEDMARGWIRRVEEYRES